jgi:hypothetical protein
MLRRPLETLKSGAQALYVAGDPLVLTNRVRINTIALVATRRRGCSNNFAVTVQTAEAPQARYPDWLLILA